MSKGEVLFIGGVIGALVLIAAMTIGYHLYTNAKNREAYMKCLRVTERMLNDDHRPGIRIVSTPYCHL